MFDAKTFTLKNGLQGIVVENHRAPVVTHMLWVKAGAADEGESAAGVAHFLEHLMFKGTAKQPPGAYSRAVAAMGGDDNAFTGQDYTAYFATIAPEHLPALMALERERFVNLAPPRQHILSEHQVIIEERRQRTDNDPLGPFTEQMAATLFAAHPYADPIIGRMKDMERLTWEDAVAYRKQWYTPANTILIVSGDTDVETVKKLATRYYGDWKGPPTEVRQRVTVPRQPANVTLTYTEPRIRQPELILMWPVPSDRQDHKKSLTLSVMEMVLDGGASTRLYQDLVVKDKKATGVDLSYDGSTWDDGTIQLVTTPVEGVSLEELHAAVTASLERAAADLTDEEVRAAITRMQRAALFARDSVAGPAMMIGQALATGSTLEDIETWPVQIAGVTTTEVKEAIREILVCEKQPACTPPLVGHVKAYQELAQ